MFASEIKRKRQAKNNTSSQYLKNDYLKSIKRDLEELKVYCEYKNLKFENVYKSTF